MLPFFLWVELLFSSLLLGGAAWFPHPLNGVAVFPSPFGACCLPSSFGWFFNLSSVGWRCLVSSSFQMLLLFLSPLAWCCLSSPPSGGVAFSLSSVGGALLCPLPSPSFLALVLPLRCVGLRFSLLLLQRMKNNNTGFKTFQRSSKDVKVDTAPSEPRSGFFFGVKRSVSISTQ